MLTSVHSSWAAWSAAFISSHKDQSRFGTPWGNCDCESGQSGRPARPAAIVPFSITAASPETADLQAAASASAAAQMAIPGDAAVEAPAQAAASDAA